MAIDCPLSWYRRPARAESSEDVKNTGERDLDDPPDPPDPPSSPKDNSTLEINPEAHGLIGEAPGV